jgi:hypothetical protein
MMACDAADCRSRCTSRDGVTSLAAPLFKLQVSVLMFLVSLQVSVLMFLVSLQVSVLMFLVAVSSRFVSTVTVASSH